MITMMREYTVFNVDQCEGLPDRVLTLGEVKVRNTDARDPTIDGFLTCSGASIREGFGEAYYRPGRRLHQPAALRGFQERRAFLWNCVPRTWTLDGAQVTP